MSKTESESHCGEVVRYTVTPKKVCWTPSYRFRCEMLRRVLSQTVFCPLASRGSACRSPLGIQWSLQHPLTNAREVLSRRGLIQRSDAKQGHAFRGDSHTDLARCGYHTYLPSPKILDFVSRAVTAKSDRRCRCRDGLVRGT